MEIMKMKEEVKQTDKAKEFDKLKEKTEPKESEKEKKQHKEKKPTDKEVIAELIESLQRTQAEFENYKKRIDKEKGEFVKYAKAELIYKILPLLDTFEIALKSTNDKEKFVKGMEIVYAQLFSTLQSEGIRPIEAFGKNQITIKSSYGSDW